MNSQCLRIEDELLELLTARRTRLMNNEKVYAAEGEYHLALQAKSEARATLWVIEDLEKLRR